MAVAADGVGEDELVGDGDDVDGGGDRVGLPDEGAVPGVEAPDVALLGFFVRLVIPAQVEPAVAAGDGAAGGDVVLGGLPEDLAGGGVEAGGDAVGAFGVAAALAGAGRVRNCAKISCRID